MSISVQGSTGRSKGKVGISWNTVNEYICADVSSDVSMNEIKRKAQTYAREVDGSYISVIRGRLASNVTTRTNGVLRTPYVFTVRALHGRLNNDLGDQIFIDKDLGENDFVSQWAQTAMNHLNGKLAGIHQSLYTNGPDSDSEEDA
mmetsp:Transcript_4709/g.7129  ORF Transcript_4709/g.7129 Transcript_4709/m.7129 type:complete len:146 (+) Transcript_4709:6-443(+)